jgi:hypothetical protein
LVGNNVPGLALMKIDKLGSNYPPLPAGDNSKRPLRGRDQGGESFDNLPIPKDVNAYQLAIWPQHPEEDRGVVKLSFTYLRLSQKGPSESCPYPGMNLQSSRIYYGSAQTFHQACMAYTVLDRQYPTGVYVDILV